MYSIGFKNFRRFEDFAPLAYSNITFLVGKNNSGKSTLVKAVLLMNSFLKGGRVDYFSFGNDVLNDANIVTYGRAFSQNGDTSEPLAFDFNIGDYRVIVRVSSDSMTSTVARVLYLSIEDLSRGYSFELVNEELTLSKVTISTEEQEGGHTSELRAQIKNLEHTLATTELKQSSKDYLALVDQLQNLIKRLNYLDAVAEEDLDYDDDYIDENEQVLSEEVESDLPFRITDSYDSSDSLLDILNAFLDKQEQIYLYKSKQAQSQIDYVEDFEAYRAFYTELFQIRQSVADYRRTIDGINQYYLGASNAKQSAFFSIRDSNNALAQAIHDYNLLGIQTGDVADRFLKHWMEVFELGTDYLIEEVGAGEGYLVLVERNGTRVHLADKGMGSSQLMLLLFRIAAIIRRHRSLTSLGLDLNQVANYQPPTQDDFGFGADHSTTRGPLVIIEEPESNLHPALQSRLCDLFLEVHNSFGIDFIIETHSEYIIRRSQVVVATEDYATTVGANPFSVVYFEREGTEHARQLHYLLDGTFDSDFGSGFFDEASISALQLMRIGRKKRKENA